MIWEFLFKISLFDPFGHQWNFGKTSYISIWLFFSNFMQFIYGSLQTFVDAREELLKVITEPKYTRWNFNPANGECYIFFRFRLKSYINYKWSLIFDYFSGRSVDLVELLNFRTWRIVPIFVNEFPIYFKCVQYFLNFHWKGNIYILKCAILPRFVGLVQQGHSGLRLFRNVFSPKEVYLYSLRSGTKTIADLKTYFKNARVFDSDVRIEFSDDESEFEELIEPNKHVQQFSNDWFLKD